MLQVVLGQEEEAEVGLVATDQAVLGSQEVVVVNDDEEMDKKKVDRKSRVHASPLEIPMRKVHVVWLEIRPQKKIGRRKPIVDTEAMVDAMAQLPGDDVGTT